MLLHHRLAGSGPVVVLLHAGVCDSRMWDLVGQELTPDYQVVAPDFRGFGQSTLTDPTYSDAADVIQLLDHLKVSRCSVVGASYGGRVALELAARVPERVERLLLLNAAADGVAPTESVKDFGAAEDALLEAGDVAGATALNVRTWLGPEASASTRELVFEMQRLAFEVQLAAGDVESTNDDVDVTTIETPTVVVSGDQDLDYFSLIAQYLVRSMPNAQGVRLSWAGHLPTLERPDEMTDLIRDWLR